MSFYTRAVGTLASVIVHEAAQARRKLAASTDLSGDGTSVSERGAGPAPSVLPAITAQNSPANSPLEPGGGPVATESDTLQYQLRHLRDSLRQVELHLAEGCQLVPGKGCDCCLKHLSDIRSFAQETIPIAARQGQGTGLLAAIVAWARELEPVTTLEASSSGQYLEQYHAESGRASSFRKKVEALQAECQPCKAALQARLQGLARQEGEGGRT